MTLGIGAQRIRVVHPCSLWLAGMEEEEQIVVVVVMRMGSIDIGLGWTRTASSQRAD